MDNNILQNFDTDLNSYNFNDMTNLYNISNKLTFQDINHLYNKYKIIEQSLKNHPINLIEIFKNIYIILNIIYNYNNYIVLTNPSYIFNDENANILVHKIRNIDNYNSLPTNTIINQILLNDENIKHINNYQIIHDSLNDYKKSIEDLTLNINNKINPNYLNTDILLPYGNHFNSIKRIHQYKNLHINSCFRDNYYQSSSSNYIYTLPEKITNVTSIKLASIEIPNTWYLISDEKKNNNFKIELTYKNKCHIFNIIIPDGNYDNDTIVNYLNNRYFCDADEKTLLSNIRFKIENISNKCIFELIENDNVNENTDQIIFSIHFIDDNDDSNIIERFGWLIGFRLARYLNIDNYIKSEGLFDAGGDRYIFLAIDDFQKNFNEENLICFNKTSLSKNILAKIPLSFGKYSLIINENDSNPLIKIRRYNGPINLSKLNVKIFDKFGDIIPLNNMDYSFSIELEILYDKN